MKFLPKMNKIMAALVAGLFVIASTADVEAAKPNGENRSVVLPIITSAEPNIADKTLRVTGDNFADEEAFIGVVEIYLAETGLTTLTVDSFAISQTAEGDPFQQLVVSGLPANIEDFAGTHLLVVRKGQPVENIVTFDVTIGAVGPEGPAGQDGADGAQGPAGQDGQDGAEGPAGADGAQGSKGDPGEAGPAGNSALSGAGVPNDADGNDGDTYLDQTTGDIYQKIASFWILTGDNLKGPEGPVGDDGAQGEAGPKGDLGDAGPKGDQGVAGPQGPAGTNGTDGTNGTNGTDGAQGPAGPVGPVGPQGPAGSDGTNGTNGTDGLDGAGLVGATINANGNLILTLTDGSAINVGQVRVPYDSISVEQEVKLSAPDATTGDYFGYRIAVDGNTMVVSALFDDDGGESAGSAYVYVRNDGVWSFQAKLTAYDGEAGDVFGWGVSIDGDTIVIGAPGDDDAGPTTGSAYVFFREGTVWTQQAKLIASDAAAGDFLGISVSISGNTIVVGSRWDDKEGVENAGSAYVFERTGTSWTEQAKLTAPDATASDEFGHDVVIDSNTVVVGSKTNDSSYVYVREGSEWSLQAILDGGYARVSGETLVLGKKTAEVAGYTVYGRIGVSWIQQAFITIPDKTQPENRFAAGSAIDGDTMVLGASPNDGGEEGSGIYYIYRRYGLTWIQQDQFVVPKVAGTYRNTAISGNTVLVGLRFDDTEIPESGSVYVFGINTVE